MRWGHHTSYFRELDTRIARWWSTDPITFHHQSPYNIFDANPVYYTDPSGASVGNPSSSQGGNSRNRPLPITPKYQISSTEIAQNYVETINESQPKGVIFAFEHSEAELNNTVRENKNWDIVYVAGVDDLKIKEYFESHEQPDVVMFYGHGVYTDKDEKDNPVGVWYGSLLVNGSPIPVLTRLSTKKYEQWKESELYQNNSEYYDDPNTTYPMKSAELAEDELWGHVSYIMNQIKPGGAFISMHCKAGQDKRIVEEFFNARTNDNTIEIYVAAQTIQLTMDVFGNYSSAPEGWSGTEAFFDLSVLNYAGGGFAYMSQSQSYTILRDQDGFLQSLRINTQGELFSITYPSNKVKVKHNGRHRYYIERFIKQKE